MTTVFADTYYFLAIINPGEREHQRAVEYSIRSRVRLVTTTWVLLEVGNALSRGSNRRLFSQLVAELNESPESEVVPPSESLFASGIELYDERPDKTWSLTDCLSFRVMERLRIREALTADHHFEQAGFVVLLK